jgi:paraquat-inducible protein A
MRDLDATVACPGCDLIQRIPPMPTGGTAHCPRCGDGLATRLGNTLERTLALSVAAAILLIVANAAPVMELSAAGLQASTTLSGAAEELWRQGRELGAVVVVFCSIVAPVAYVSFMLTLLLSLRRNPAPSWIGAVMRGSSAMAPWSMDEVVMLAILVALIKIAALANTTPGIGMYALGALVVVLAAIKVTFDPREVWRKVPWTT